MAKKKRAWPPIGEPLPRPVVDNHTHLPLHDGEIPSPGGVRLPLEEQLARAKEVGVERIITSGCELPDLAPTVALARAHPEVRAALAIHPNEAALHAGYLEKSPDGYEHTQEEHHVPLPEALAAVRELLTDPVVVAVGETGLDYFRTAGPGREAQKEAFRTHLEMGRELGLPVQIHDRDAHADTIEVLRDPAWKDVTAVFHCYTGDAAMARELAAHGWYASFAGPLTYPANEELRRVLLEMPPQLVMVETDAPYLTPVPYRGNPNASYVMPYTVRAIAELWQVPVEEAADRLTETTNAAYGRW